MKKFKFSTFEKWLIWIAILVIGWIFISPIDIKYGLPTSLGAIPMIIITGASVLVLYNNFIKKLFILKYRIREEPSGDKIIYKADVLTIEFFFIIWWSWDPVRSESLYSYTESNAFGATRERTVFVGKKYDSKEKALAEIEKHRLEIKENCDKFFKRPKPKEEKITYM